MSAAELFAEFRHAMALERRNHEGLGERRPLVEVGRESEQLLMVDRVDLVQHQDLRRRAIAAAWRESPRPPRPRPCARRPAGTTASASPAPPQADVTMARSSRRLGAKMPGVSTKMICAAPSSAMPRTSARVVCTFRETIDTFAPTSWLSSVDLPALGAPISATKPQAGVCRALRLSLRSTPEPLRGQRISGPPACSAKRLELPSASRGAKPSTTTSMTNTGA